MARATVGGRDPVCRALHILEELARDGGDIGVTDIAEKVSLNKSTVYRMLQSMMAAGFVRQGRQEGTYRASIKLAELGNLVLEHIEIRQEASPYLKQLAAETGETVHLVAMDDCFGVYIDKVDGSHSMRMYSRVGRRTPLYCTGVGKILLAELPYDKREETLRRSLAAYEYRRFTPNTLLDVAAIQRELDWVSAQGYAVDREEHEQGVVCVAAPIRNYQGKVVAACSVTAPVFRIAASRIEALIPVVVSTAAEISRSLGYTATMAAGK